jgi:hypothetical protein
LSAWLCARALKPSDRGLQQLLGVFFCGAVALDLFGVYPGLGVELGFLEAVQSNLARVDNSAEDEAGRFATIFAGESVIA